MALSRRDLLRGLGALAVAGGTASAVAASGRPEPQVWQIDPDRCTRCGRCATACVLSPSAVKAVHAAAICGYCDLCTGFFRTEAPELSTAAENQLCPFAAIKRTFVEDPYFEYAIDESACVGCARCVQGCSAYGNGSLFLQIRHDRCANCNQCRIAAECPSQAITRVPADAPYRIKSKAGKT